MKPLPSIEFSKKGYEKLQVDLDRLTQERAAVLIRLQTAREMGDLSENGAYKAARFELGSIDRQLRQLQYLIRFGKISTRTRTDVINFGSTVTIKMNYQQMEFTLVNGYESDPKLKKLSIHSPIGQAIMGKKAGDRVIVRAPAGETEIIILSVI